MACMGKHLAVLIVIIFFLTSLLSLKTVHGIETDFRGQLSGWTIESLQDDQWENSTGVRYIPNLSLSYPLNGQTTLDTEISINGYWTNDENYDGENLDMDVYRLWFRLSSSQYEIRCGLQKIDFGSAILLRPLMWFDRMDPRDPLRLTKGVYALLGRYYFIDNTNIWIWGLTGNDETKGWETSASHKEKPEYGGRVQSPVGNGEIALTYNHREIDAENFILGDAGDDGISENRFALDGKWDMGVGLWFEGVVVHQDHDQSLLGYKKFLNFGLDYTFDMGNGLNIIGEHLWVTVSEDLFDTEEAGAISAFSINYPLGVLDTVSVITFYDWDNQELYRHFSWERRYDSWRFYVMGFWNPETMQIYENEQAGTLFAGRGLQLLIVFNH